MKKNLTEIYYASPTVRRYRRWCRKIARKKNFRSVTFRDKNRSSWIKVQRIKNRVLLPF